MNPAFTYRRHLTLANSLRSLAMLADLCSNRGDMDFNDEQTAPPPELPSDPDPVFPSLPNPTNLYPYYELPSLPYKPELTHPEKERNYDKS